MASRWIATPSAEQIAAAGDFVESTTVTDIVVLTQAAFDALATKDAATLYVIVG